MLRRTKIVVTLGPATEDEQILNAVLQAGASVFRLNFSHGSQEDQLRRMQLVRQCAAKLNITVGVLADLQGPKIRIARFTNKKVVLQEGAEFTLDASLPVEDGTEACVGIDYKQLPDDVRQGDSLLLDDGRIVLSVKKVDSPRIVCTVIVGGELSNNKGINRRGGGLSAQALTDKDKADLAFAVNAEVNYIAVSFPRDGKDIELAKTLIAENGGKTAVIAKVERAEAVENIDEIILASDGVMVARGDLAVEVGDAEVPPIQKMMIQRARALNRPVITATQMLESMIDAPIPTRAEVSDVANAVLDHTDAVMLSAETAVGKYPVEAVATMARVCDSAERHPSTRRSKHRVECRFQRIDEAIAMSTVYAANHMDIKAIISLTESGSTALMMSRIRTGIPIFGLSRDPHTLSKMTLYRDVFPIPFDVTGYEYQAVNLGAIEELKRRNLVASGDRVILTKGDHMGVMGGTNAMKILTVT